MLILFAQGEGRAILHALLPITAVLDLVHVDRAERLGSFLTLVWSLGTPEKVRLLGNTQIFYLVAIHLQFWCFGRLWLLLLKDVFLLKSDIIRAK